MPCAAPDDARSIAPAAKGQPGSTQSTTSLQACTRRSLASSWPNAVPATGTTNGAALGRGDTTTTSTPASQARRTAATVAAAAAPGNGRVAPDDQRSSVASHKAACKLASMRSSTVGHV